MNDRGRHSIPVLLRTRLMCLLLLIPSLLGARLMEAWTYQEMFNKADLVVIGRNVSTSDLDEHILLPGYKPPLPVVGVITKFKIGLVLKGPKETAEIELHHYRYANRNDEDAVSNAPNLIDIKSNFHASFLLFLIKDKDGKYVPLSGQTDPAAFSVLVLQGGAE